MMPLPTGLDILQVKKVVLHMLYLIILQGSKLIPDFGVSTAILKTTDISRRTMDLSDTMLNHAISLKE